MKLFTFIFCFFFLFNIHAQSKAELKVKTETQREILKRFGKNPEYDFNANKRYYQQKYDKFAKDIEATIRLCKNCDLTVLEHKKHDLQISLSNCVEELSIVTQKNKYKLAEKYNFFYSQNRKDSLSIKKNTVPQTEITQEKKQESIYRAFIFKEFLIPLNEEIYQRTNENEVDYANRLYKKTTYKISTYLNCKEHRNKLEQEILFLVEYQVKCRSEVEDEKKKFHPK